jgi:diguanylate cyclase (GGDEF)-like protein
VLMFFSIMGGYVSSLRKKLGEAHAGLERALLRIEHLAARDELTGVLNRRSLVEVLDQQKGRSDRYGAVFSILMVDIDHFKLVNDTHGHPAGDAVLARFAKVAAASLRQSDTFGRYGGEEFLAVLDQTTLEGACIVGERMCATAKRLQFDEFAATLRVTVSLGIAQYRPREDWHDLIKRADQALYRAKSGGRDRIEYETMESQEPVT